MYEDSHLEMDYEDRYIFDEIEEEVDYNIGTCQGCGSYGEAGKICIRFNKQTRRNEECGEYI